MIRRDGAARSESVAEPVEDPPEGLEVRQFRLVPETPSGRKEVGAEAD